MKILIAEDEKIIREDICRVITKKISQITNIVMAENGSDASQKLSSFVPDILITDIEMPKKNGIALAEDVLNANPDCKIIFISGYSEKEYLKAALDLNVERYLEKPFKMDELIAVVQKVVYQILNLKDALAALKNYNDDKLIKLLIKPASQKTNLEIDKIVQGSELNSYAIYNILLFQFFDNSYTLTELKGIVTAELLGGVDKYIITNKSENIMIALVCTKASNHSKDYLKEIISHNMGKLSGKNPEISVSVFIGRDVSEIKEAYQSYFAATVLLQQGFIAGKNVILSDVSIAQGSEQPVVSDKISELEKALSECDAGKCKKILKSVYCEIKYSKKGLMSSFVRRYCGRIFHTIESAFYNRNIIDADKKFTLERVYEAKIFDEIMSFLESMTDFYFASLTNTIGNLTKAVIKYINDHYGDEELSLKKISDYSGYSIQHICNIFKKEMNTTVNNYIIIVRINKSKQLLTNTNLSFSEIAENIGLCDAGYYAKLFKRLVGVSPKEYRNRGI